MSNKVVFKVKAHIEIPTSKIVPFQGDLKKLSKENENKLRQMIIGNGFNFAPHVWKQDSKYFILDGHQRVHVLTMLEKEGYKFVDKNNQPLDGIPCNTVEADSIEDAKNKVLQAVSQYGKIDRQGFEEFISDVDFELDGYDFPDFDFNGACDDIEPNIVDPEDAFSKLGEGDKKDDFEQITFTLTGEQAELIRACVKDCLTNLDEEQTGNPNKNGNALSKPSKGWRFESDLCAPLQNFNNPS